MAERRAINKYYPPDWDPSKGSLNSYHKSHPLRSRAKKVEQGVLVVRFELPYNVWCLGCGGHVGMGKRYNAEKSKIGNYYSTPIYQFKMKCHLCDNYILIKTDPSKFDYVVISGARKQTLSCVDDESTDDKNLIGTSAYERAEEAKRRLTDSMLKLERMTQDKTTPNANRHNLVELRKWSTRIIDSFHANQIVRAKYRANRKKIEHAKERDKRLLKKCSLMIPLASYTPSDAARARKMINQFEAEKSKRSDSVQRSALLRNQTKRFDSLKPSHVHNSSDCLRPSAKIKVEK